jgi:hypothetical protein
MVGGGIAAILAAATCLACRRFTCEKFRRIQRDCNETSMAWLHCGAVWRIRPANVVIGDGLMS